MQANHEKIFSIQKRRPSTAGEIAGAFGMRVNEAFKYLGSLMQEGRIRVERTSGSLYYMAAKRRETGSHPRVYTGGENTASAFDVSGGFCEKQSRDVPNKQGPFNDWLTSRQSGQDKGLIDKEKKRHESFMGEV